MPKTRSPQRLSLTGKRWLFSDCDEGRRQWLVRSLGVSPLVAQLLLNRGLADPDGARAFLDPDLKSLHDPDLLPGMAEAVARIRKAIAAGEKILLYGDYDADGVTALALLLEFFRLVGVQPQCYIPNRVEEGYGVHTEAIKAAAADGVGLIITADCGVSAADGVERARQLGMDVIVTDHHEPPRVVPRATAVVNPKLTGSLYPFRDLSGVGVAFKLAWALAQSFSPGKRVTPEFREFLLEAMALVAVGTVADVVPLLGENRVFAVYGLEALRRCKKPGLSALVAQAGLRDKSIRPRDVAFKIGPRLNAAGRLADASLCVELLTCRDPERAAAIARELEARNRERQRLQNSILNEARAQLAGQRDLERRRAIVLADEAWHAGVVGIVAAKLAEELLRPTVLLCLDGELARGSARSVPRFDLFSAIEACDSVLLSYGGHRQAAGLKLRRQDIPRFIALFERQVQEWLGGEEPCGTLEVDAEVPLAAVDPSLVAELEQLEPCGQGNPPPVLACGEVTVAGQPTVMGTSGQHIAFYVAQGNKSLRAVGFGMGAMYEHLAAGGVVCDVAFTPRPDNYRGTNEVELILRDVRIRG